MTTCILLCSETQSLPSVGSMHVKGHWYLKYPNLMGLQISSVTGQCWCTLGKVSTHQTVMAPTWQCLSTWSNGGAHRAELENTGRWGEGHTCNPSARNAKSRESVFEAGPTYRVRWRTARVTENDPFLETNKQTKKLILWLKMYDDLWERESMTQLS